MKKIVCMLLQAFVLVGYTNQVEYVHVLPREHGHAVVTIGCKDPVLYQYAPRTYQEYQKRQHMQRFFFPKTKMHKSLVQDVKHRLRKLPVAVHETEHPIPGIEVIVTSQGKKVLKNLDQQDRDSVSFYV